MMYGMFFLCHNFVSGLLRKLKPKKPDISPLLKNLSFSSSESSVVCKPLAFDGIGGFSFQWQLVSRFGVFLTRIMGVGRTFSWWSKPLHLYWSTHIPFTPCTPLLLQFLTFEHKLCNPLHQFPRSKSRTSWRLPDNKSAA